MSEAADRARAAIGRGDLITAYDVTVSVGADGDDSADIRHLQVLALARMGDTERASELFHSYGLDRSQDPHQKAIGARLAKDRALLFPPGPKRVAALIEAAEAYRAIFMASGDPYPGINAASLFLLAGDGKTAAGIAALLLDDPAVAACADYYMAATRAEALMILDRLSEARDTLAAAATMIGDDHGARSTTSRQLRLLAAHLDLGDAGETLLGPIAPPIAIHFCGHIFTADVAAETTLRAAIDEQLDRDRVGFAYGALAAGADILIAERMLARGGELHVVLPFAVEDFIAQSVRPAGEGWVARFEACMAAAASRTLATEMGYVGDPGQYAYASRVAMGLATLRSQHLGNTPLQLAVWDGAASNGPAGTGADVAAWQAGGEVTRRIDPGDVRRDLPAPSAPVETSDARDLAAILFTDFPGFSRLAEVALPRFWNGVMRRVADVLDAHGDQVLARNSWGDALYAVAASASAAAEIALELQQRLRELDYAALGFEGGGGMRIGAHYGPAYRARDHITGQINFYGTEVSRAARIEPVTPPGAVFVTEPFAAILAHEAPDRFHCRYVGRIELAKGYGAYRMYRLDRAEA